MVPVIALRHMALTQRKDHLVRKKIYGQFSGQNEKCLIWGENSFCMKYMLWLFQYFKLHVYILLYKLESKFYVEF